MAVPWLVSVTCCAWLRITNTAHPGFHAFWADGNPDAFSRPHLYFCNQTGDKVWRLPYDMKADFAEPELMTL
jgi:hypothetical protein